MAPTFGILTPEKGVTSILLTFLDRAIYARMCCQCVANVFQGGAIYAGILKSKVSKPPHKIHPVGCARFFFFPFSFPLSLSHSLPPFPFSFPFPLSFSPVPFPFSLPFLRSLSSSLFSVFPFSFLLTLSPSSFFSPFSFPSPFHFLLSPFSFLLSPFSFLLSPFSFLLSPFSFLLSPFSFLLSPFSFLLSPFSFLLSLLLSLSLYKWNAVVTYRWRNPQLSFPQEKSSCQFLYLSPPSFPSSFHCPFPFLLFPFPFPFPLSNFPFPFLLSPFSCNWMALSQVVAPSI